MLQTVLYVIKRPVNTFEKISKKPIYYWPAAFLIAVVFPTILSLSVVGIITFESVFLNAAAWLITVAGVYYIGRLFKGKGRFMQTFSCMGYAAVPGLISSLLSALITLFIPRGLLEELKAIPVDASSEIVMPLIGQVFTLPIIIISMVIFAMVIWEVVLSVIAGSTIHKFSRLKAALTLLLSWISAGIIIGAVKGLFAAFNGFF